MENGLVMKDMAMGFKFGQTGHVMRAIGRPIKLKATVNSYILLEMSTMANGKVIKLMDLEFLPMSTVQQNTKDHGLKTFSMEKEKKFIAMEIYMRVNLKMEKGMVKENIFSMMDDSIQEIGFLVIWKERENLLGLTEELMKDHGKIIKSMEKVFFIGKMAEGTKEPMNKIKEKEKVNINGLTGRSMSENSKTT